MSLPLSNCRLPSPHPGVSFLATVTPVAQSLRSRTNSSRRTRSFIILDGSGSHFPKKSIFLSKTSTFPSCGAIHAINCKLTSTTASRMSPLPAAEGNRVTRRRISSSFVNEMCPCTREWPWLQENTSRNSIACCFCLGRGVNIESGNAEVTDGCRTTPLHWSTALA